MHSRLTLLGLLCFLLAANLSCKVYHKAGTTASRHDFNIQKAEEDAEILELIAPYKKELDVEMQEVIGVAKEELFKQLPEGTLNNWAADAIWQQCNKLDRPKVDFAVVNYGGLRIGSLPQGHITVGRIFELMPFDNALVVLEVDGEIVHQLFARMAEYGGWPVSQGVVCQFSPQGALLHASIHGQPIAPEKIYRIGLSDYIANGGDQCSFFKGLPQEATGLLFRDAFLQQVKDQTARGEPIHAKIEGRMQMLE